MLTREWTRCVIPALCLLAACAINSGAAAQQQSLQIDVPTRLLKGDVVIDFGHLVLNGDMPFALGDTHILAGDFKQWGVNGHIVLIFHGDAAYLVLNDETYNANRKVTTGNPYKGILEQLAKDGVQLELCGATAKGNHWSNSDLLPEIKVNVDAMARVTELEQRGFTLIYQ